MKLILSFALISLIKFTSSELTVDNEKPLPIYYYVSDHSEHGSLDTNKNKQIFRDKRQNDVQILSYDTKNLNNVRSFGYELSDGTSRQESLKFIDSQKDNQVNQIASVSGTSKYISKEGYLVKNSFTADDKGYASKVLFGKNVKSDGEGIQQAAYTSPVRGQGSGGGGLGRVLGGGFGNGPDSSLLCSLVGGIDTCL